MNWPSAPSARLLLLIKMIKNTDFFEKPTFLRKTHFSSKNPDSCRNPRSWLPTPIPQESPIPSSSATCRKAQFGTLWGWGRGGEGGVPYRPLFKCSYGNDGGKSPDGHFSVTKTPKNSLFHMSKIHEKHVSDWGFSTPSSTPSSTLQNLTEPPKSPIPAGIPDSWLKPRFLSQTQDPGSNPDSQLLHGDPAICRV